MKNKNLNSAKSAKNDEFYTQITDIEKEVNLYKDQFKGKVVFCNCDDPEESNFWTFFVLNFERLGLKKLISTHYEVDKPSYKLEIIGDINHDGKVNKLDTIKTPLKQNGDFRSPECIEILKEVDIVVSNPPFSCYSSDTEVLTNNGWKLFKDVKEDDLIMSLNLKENKSEYVGIKRFYKKMVNEELLHFKNRRLDLLVTKNHRMIAKNRCGLKPMKINQEGEEILIRADEVKSFHTIPTKGFNWVGKSIDKFILPGVLQLEQSSRREIIIPDKEIKMKDWLEFFGFWIADGCCRQGKNSNGNSRYTISIKQNEQNEEYVKNLYKNIGFICKIEKK